MLKPGVHRTTEFEELPRGESSNGNHIKMFLHCGRCLREKPDGVSPKDWSRTQTGWTTWGIQVWCNRHECNVLHIDFQGHQFPADTSRPKVEGDA